MRRLPADEAAALAVTRVLPQAVAKERALDDATAKVCAAIAPSLVTVLEHVFDVLARHDRDHIVRVVQAALTRAPGAAEVSTHPADVVRMRAVLTPEVRLNVDASIRAGGAFVHGPDATVDARAQTQLFRALWRCLAEHDV